MRKPINNKLSEEKMMKYITLIILLFVSTTVLAGSGGGFAPGIVDHTPTKSEETQIT